MLVVAYELIKGNPGSMTPGRTTETLEGVSIKQLKAIRHELRMGTFKFDPARRIYIPKPGKTEKRPLDISGQKIVQKSLEIALSLL